MTWGLSGQRLRELRDAEPIVETNSRLSKLYGGDAECAWHYMPAPLIQHGTAFARAWCLGKTRRVASCLIANGDFSVQPGVVPMPREGVPDKETSRRRAPRRGRG